MRQPSKPSQNKAPSLKVKDPIEEKVASDPPVDRRTLRATGRTTQFTTRITEELHHEIKVFTARKRLKQNEFVEQAFLALKEKSGE